VHLEVVRIACCRHGFLVTGRNMMGETLPCLGRLRPAIPSVMNAGRWEPVTYSIGAGF
jgi:hypothetical protein